MHCTVEWSPRAVEDLFAKVTTERVADELRRIADSSLDCPKPPDGGPVNQHGSVYWRRGVPCGEQAPAPSRRNRRDGSSDEEQAHDFILVYHRRGRAGEGWYVIAVLHVSEVAFGFGHTDVDR
jgi:hypothetical protein